MCGAERDGDRIPLCCAARDADVSRAEGGVSLSQSMLSLGPTTQRGRLGRWDHLQLPPRPGRGHVGVGPLRAAAPHRAPSVAREWAPAGYY